MPTCRVAHRRPRYPSARLSSHRLKWSNDDADAAKGGSARLGPAGPPWGKTARVYEDNRSQSLGQDVHGDLALLFRTWRPDGVDHARGTRPTRAPISHAGAVQPAL